MSILEAVAADIMHMAVGSDQGWYRIIPQSIANVETLTSSSTSEQVKKNKFSAHNFSKQSWKGEAELRLAEGCTLSPAWRMLIFGDGSPTRLLGLLTGSPLCVTVLGMDKVSKNGGVVDPPDAISLLLSTQLSSSSSSSSLAASQTVSSSSALQSQQIGALFSTPSSSPSLASSPLVPLPPSLPLPDPSSIIRRRVWLENERGERLGYAVSWWKEEIANSFFTGDLAKNPIGGNMATGRLDVYRELVEVVCGRCPELEKEFGMNSRKTEQAEETEETQQSLLWGRYYIMWRGGQPLNIIYEVFSPTALEKYMGSYN